MLSNSIGPTVTFRTTPAIREAIRTAFRGLIDQGHLRATQSDVIRAAIFQYAATFPQAATAGASLTPLTPQ